MNMEKKFLLNLGMVSVLSCFSASAFASSVMEIDGNMTAHKVVVNADNTSINGNLTAHEATFNNLTINGALSASTIKANGDVVVNGAFSVEGGQFKNLTVNGVFDCRHCQIEGELKVASTEVSLADSKVKTVIIHADKPALALLDSKKAILRLKGKSTVGDIDFDSEPGVVKIDSQAKVTGNVSNGAIEASNS